MTRPNITLLILTSASLLAGCATAPSRRALACPPARNAFKSNQRQAFPKHIKTMNYKSTIAILAALVLGGSFAFAADSGVPKDYPLTKCVISDEKLGEHGKPVKVTSDGTDVWLCCKSCIKDINKDPKKYAKMVKDAQAKK